MMPIISYWSSTIPDIATKHQQRHFDHDTVAMTIIIVFAINIIIAIAVNV